MKGEETSRRGIARELIEPYGHYCKYAKQKVFIGRYNNTIVAIVPIAARVRRLLFHSGFAQLLDLAETLPLRRVLAAERILPRDTRHPP